MEKSIEKFLENLKIITELTSADALDIIRRYCNDAIILEKDVSKIDMYVESKNLIRVFSTSLEDWCTHHELFNDFAILSMYLKAFKIKDQDVYNIILHILNKNLQSTFLIDGSDVVILDYEKFLNFPFKNITMEGAKALIDKCLIVDLLSLDEESLSKRDKLVINEIKDNIDKFAVDFQSYFPIYEDLNKYLFNEDNLSEEGISKVIEALKFLQLSDYVIAQVSRVLNNKLRKKLAKSSLIFNPEITKRKKEKISDNKYLSEKEYRGILKEIRKYYDPYHIELKQTLSYEEMLKVASLMLKLEYDEMEVASLIRVASRNFDYTDEDPIIKYLRLFDQIKFYYGEDALAYAEDIFKELMLSIPEDYSEYKKMLLEEINKFNLNLNYKYEINLAKNLNN